MLYIQGLTIVATLAFQRAYRAAHSVFSPLRRAGCEGEVVNFIVCHFAEEYSYGPIRVGINGFGRIGATSWAALALTTFEIVAVNASPHSALANC